MAQVRDVISGWAGEVTGSIWARDLGRVVVLGKRMGEIKGLLLLAE